MGPSPTLIRASKVKYNYIYSPTSPPRPTPLRAPLARVSHLILQVHRVLHGQCEYDVVL